MCTEHFTKSDFKIGSFSAGARPRLKSGAVPHVFPWTKCRGYVRPPPKVRPTPAAHHVSMEESRKASDSEEDDRDAEVTVLKERVMMRFVSTLGFQIV